MMQPKLIEASPSESQIWGQLIKDPNDPSCTLSYKIVLAKNYTFDEIHKALYDLLLSHPMLNFQFFEHKGKLFKKYVSPTPDCCTDASTSEFNTKYIFNASYSKLFNFTYLNENNQTTLFIHLSHLIFDGSCFNLLLSCIKKHLTQVENHQVAPFNFEEKKTSDDDIRYWQQYLNDNQLHTKLPFALPGKRKALLHSTYCFPNLSFTQLNDYLRKNKVSMFNAISTALSITLHHYVSEQNEESQINLGYFSNLYKKRHTFGCTINLLPLLIECRHSNKLSDIVNLIKSTRQNQRSHQHVPIQSIMNSIDMSNFHFKPFNVIINESEGLMPHSTSEFYTNVCGLENQSQKNELTLVYRSDDSQLTMRLESNLPEISSQLLKQLSINIEKTLSEIITDDTQLVSSLSFTNETASMFKGPLLDLSAKTLSERLIESISCNKKKIAIRSYASQWSYQKVCEEICNLYHLLQKLDKSTLKNGIGISITKSEYLPISLLTSLLSHIPFIPISENTIDAEKKKIINKTHLQTVIVDNSTIAKFSKLSSSLELINIDSLSNSEKMPPGIDLHHVKPILNNELAYILFTSGSSGEPKGVKVTHHNLLNFLSSILLNPGFTEFDTILSLTSISFDISINELIIPFFSGASLFITPDHTRSDVRLLQDCFSNDDISVIQTTPSTVSLLQKNTVTIQRNTPLRIWVGGEPLTKQCCQYLLENQCHIYNMYGPTEATIWASATRITEAHRFSIHKALCNTSLHVLNLQKHNLPLGIPGELVIEGDLVSDGYLNQSSDAFEDMGNNVKRYYTGDKVLALSSEKLIFLSRYNSQTKIRGFRIEIEEINHFIHQHVDDFIGSAVVTSNPEPQLSVFYSSPTSIDSKMLSQCLARDLIFYKIPQNYIALESIPLTSSGKINLKLLKDLDPTSFAKVPINHHKSQAKSKRVYSKLAQLIDDIFSISIDDFDRSLLDYGFDSLKFNVLSEKLSTTFSKSISPHQFYHVNTINKLSRYLGTTSKLASLAQTQDIKPLSHSEPIAIIGYDAILPGCNTLNQFWELLTEKKQAISSHQRGWLVRDIKAGFIDDIDAFDRKFFNLSPIEVKYLDFRQRLLLQCAFRTSEHAGMSPQSSDENTIGCFIAATGADPMLHQLREQLPHHPYSLSGSSASMLANRLSFMFNWHGPSQVIDTACSSSLSAMARAIDCLRLGKASACFVGSANLITDPFLSDTLKAGGFLSDSYQCASFQNDADGYVRGEGIIGFMLKPLSQAKLEGDEIHGVIHLISENHSGKSASLTAPSAHAQFELLKNAYSPELAQHLRHVETHGTGTKLGDPIEFDALRKFEQHGLTSNPHKYISLGALKQNIGHLEASAGFASLLKMILSIKHKKLPNNARFDNLNEYINLHSSKFTLNTDNIGSIDLTKQNIFGISSFGFGGSNTHLVLSNSVAENKRSTSETSTSKELPLLAFLLSAKSITALRQRILNLQMDLSSQHELVDIAYTLATTRQHYAFKSILFAKTKEELYQKLDLALGQTNHQLPISPSKSEYSIYNDYTQNLSINWDHLFENLNKKKVSLTPYTFDKAPPIVQPKIQKEFTINNQDIIVNQHKVFNTKILPGVAYIDFLLNHFSNDLKKPNSALCLTHIHWLAATTVGDSNIKFSLNVDNEKNRFTFSRKNNVTVAQGEFSLTTSSQGKPQWVDNILAIETHPSWRSISVAKLYERFESLGIEYGDYFKQIKTIKTHQNYAITTLTNCDKFSLIPMLDAMFQTGMAIDIQNNQLGLMPFSCGQFTLCNPSLLQQAKTFIVYTTKYSAFRTSYVVIAENQVVLNVVDLGVKSSAIKQTV